MSSHFPFTGNRYYHEMSICTCNLFNTFIYTYVCIIEEHVVFFVFFINVSYVFVTCYNFIILLSLYFEIYFLIINFSSFILTDIL